MTRLGYWVLLGLTLKLGSVQAQVETIDFDNLTQQQLGVLYCCDFYKLGFSLDIDGYNFTNTGHPDGNSEYGLAVWGTDHSANADPGGFTLRAGYSDSVTTMTRIDNATFSVWSVDIANWNNAYALSGPVTIRADLEGGGTVTKNITTDLFLGLETVELIWTDITALHFESGASYPYQFDNIHFVPDQNPDPGPAPIPLTRQITMTFDDVVLNSCSPCQAYGFTFQPGFFGGNSPNPYQAPPNSDGEALYGIGGGQTGRHFLMTPVSGLEFGIESLDVNFWPDDNSYGMFYTDTWVLRGYDTSGKPLAEVTIQQPNEAGAWVSVDLDPIWHSGVSKIEFFGQQDSYGMFAFMDNLVVNVPPTQVEFDVQPWFTENEIDPASPYGMPVGIYTTSVADGDAVDFDATQIDASTVKLGYGEAPVLGTTTVLDLDGDLDNDLLLGFTIADSGVVCEDTDFPVSGETTDGEPFSGVDSITTINCETSSCHP